MKLEFNDNGTIYSLNFIKFPNYLNPNVMLSCVDIKYNGMARILFIENNKLIVRLDHTHDFYKLSDNVINYVNKLIKLKVFL